MGVSEPIRKAIEELGFVQPMPVQEEVIPYLLGNRNDVIALAQTGTGKTAAFGIPLLQRIDTDSKETQAIVLSPTRELCLQIADDLNAFARYIPHVHIVPVYGGASIEAQIRSLRHGAQIIVATPGRLIDLMHRGKARLDNARNVVFDEADEMLNMGFQDSITEILEGVPEERNTLLFSATMSREVERVAKGYLHDYKEIVVGSRNEGAENVNHVYYMVNAKDKYLALKRIVDFYPKIYAIVFCRTKIGVDEVATRLVAQGYSAEGLHGDVSQAQREKILRKFRDKAVNILVATDVAARGIDVSNLSHVINYSLPQDSESYVHRIGRTGRAGNQGTAITFISGAELRRFNWMMRDIKADIKRETLPSPQDIVAMKRAKIKDDLQEIVANESYGDYADIAAELLESYAPDVALGALLRLAFRSELDQSNYPEIRSFSVDRKGKARLFLALGGRDGYTARRIVEMLKRKCGLRDKNIDDVRVFENYSLVSVPFSDAEAVVGQLNASGGRRRIAKIDGSDAENGGGKRRRPATEGRNGGEGASGSESAGEPRSETRGRRKAGQPEGAEEFRSERRPRRETAETADDAGERRPVTRSRKKAENDWNASPAGGNDGFDWEAFQRYDDAAAWEKPKRGGGTRSVRRSGRPVTTGRQAAPKRIAAKGRKR